MSHGTLCSCWLKNMATPLTTHALFKYQFSLQRTQRDHARRIRVYTTGGIQIGLAGVGQGDKALTFPANFLCGDALKSRHWIREATTQELEQDSRWYRILTQTETPSKLAHQVGDVLAIPEDYMGQYGDTMIAMTMAMTAETQSFTEVPNGHGMKEKLEDIKTPPTPDFIPKRHRQHQIEW